jgi:N4-gp56 family major capsid protein
MANEIVYGNKEGTTSSVGSQINIFHFYKKALVEAAKESYFSQMADVRSMPKNMGKTIKQYQYLPILDDRNMNSQGIDANGALASAVASTSGVKATSFIKVVLPENAGAGNQYDSVAKYFRGDAVWDTDWATTAAAALATAKASARGWLISQGVVDADGATSDTTYAELVATYASAGADGSFKAATGLAVTAGYEVYEYRSALATNYGNFYASSKDVGAISGKIPPLSETGGRVNRVGMKRIELEGTIDKFGFFTEYTQDSMDFDTDSELMMHLTQEVVKAANEMTEDQIQIDLLNAAGVVRYTGAATSTASLQGNDITSPFAVGNTNDALTYDDLVKLGIELDNNRCPKNTTVISGSRMVDTKVVNAARYIYIGSELLPTIMRLTDYHGNKAFIPVAQYASAGTVARGEVGAVDNFRFIVVPEMMHWAAAGAAVTVGEGTVYKFSGDASGNPKFDVFPMLVVGEGSFTTIGFQTDGKSVKFQTKHVKPGDNHTTDDPYGETGFYSIKWWYGFLPLRPERIALVKTIAEWG